MITYNGTSAQKESWAVTEPTSSGFQAIVFPSQYGTGSGIVSELDVWHYYSKLHYNIASTNQTPTQDCIGIIFP